MVRVKDAEKSLRFYQDVLGMSLMRTHEAQSAGFNLYFLGYPGAQGMPADGKTSDREGLLELTWNHGTEKDAAFKYHSGNEEPRGFGHICESRRASVKTTRRADGPRRQASRWITSMPRAGDSTSSSARGRRG